MRGTRAKPRAWMPCARSSRPCSTTSRSIFPGVVNEAASPKRRGIWGDALVWDVRK